MIGTSFASFAKGQEERANRSGQRSQGRESGQDGQRGNGQMNRNKNPIYKQQGSQKQTQNEISQASLYQWRLMRQPLDFVSPRHTKDRRARVGKTTITEMVGSVLPTQIEYQDRDGKG